LVIITNDSLVRTLNDNLKSEPETPDLRPSSNVDFPVAWITGPLIYYTTNTTQNIVDVT
jgi:hypothetical protein